MGSISSFFVVRVLLDDGDFFCCCDRGRSGCCSDFRKGSLFFYAVESRKSLSIVVIVTKLHRVQLCSLSLPTPSHCGGIFFPEIICDQDPGRRKDAHGSPAG